MYHRSLVIDTWIASVTVQNLGDRGKMRKFVRKGDAAISHVPKARPYM